MTWQGIIFDRGYLSVDVDVTKLANVQRLVTNACLVSGKPVVIASQILESMCNSPRPSRSEAFDLFNCVLSGVDAYILSSETATGTLAF